jgi:DNA-binding MarR family transcriptional regulator
MAHAENVESLVREIRLASQRLKAAADDLHRDLGLTAAMRAVLETLSVRGTLTVPQIARENGVTRQHVQALVDALWERRCVILAANPGHARSPLVGLTDKGRAVLETCSECDQALVRDISVGLTTDVATALSVMRRLNAALIRRAS